MGSTSINMNKRFSVTYFTLHLLSSTLAARGPKELTLEEACRVTRYRQLCVQTLSRFSNMAHHTPYVWARGGVDVTIWDVKALNSTLVDVRNSRKLAGKGKSAIVDCVKVMDAALNRLQHSLQILRTIKSGRFQDELGSVMTWLRSAIRDEDTCMDRINNAGRGEILSAVASLVANATHMTNNALALNNYLARVGMSSSPNQ